MNQPPLGMKEFLAPPRFDMAMMERRYRLKSRAFDFYPERRETVDRGDRRKSNEFIDFEYEAAEDECVLWMLDKYQKRLKQEQLQLLKHLYETVAAGLAMLRRFIEVSPVYDTYEPPHPRDFPPQSVLEEGLPLLQETNASLAIAVRDAGLKGRDHEQQSVYEWLRDELRWRDLHAKRIDRRAALDYEQQESRARRIDGLRQQLESFMKKKTRYPAVIKPMGARVV